MKRLSKKFIDENIIFMEGGQNFTVMIDKDACTHRAEFSEMVARKFLNRVQLKGEIVNRVTTPYYYIFVIEKKGES